MTEFDFLCEDRETIEHKKARRAVARHLAGIYRDEMKAIAYDMANVSRNPFTEAPKRFRALTEKIVRENNAEYAEYICNIFWEYYFEEYDRCVSA